MGLFDSIVHGVEHAAKSVGHDVAHAAKSVGHDVEHVASGAAHAVSSTVHGATHAAAGAAHGLFDAGKTAFGAVSGVAKSAAKTTENVAGKAVHGAEGAASGLVHTAGQFASGAEKTATGLLHDAKNVGSSAVHGVESAANWAGKTAHSAAAWGGVHAADLASDVGVGKVLDGLGVAKPNQQMVNHNRMVTKDYTKLSDEMHDVLGKDSGANWATFASFASSRVGQAIRNQDDPGGRAGRDVVQIASDLGLGHLPGIGGKINKWQQEYQGESKQASIGNTKVWSEIAPKFQQFINTFKGEKQPDAQKWNQFAKGFQQTPGKPGDQTMLLDGFQNYYKSMFQSGAQKQQSVTLGNIQIGLHEQMRLQPQIAAAFPKGQSAALTSQATAPIGNETLGLGKNVAPPKGGNSTFPSYLQNIQNPQLRQVLQQYAPNVLHGTTQGSAASDWTNLDQRMKWIATLFASHGQDPSLFSVVPT